MQNKYLIVDLLPQEWEELKKLIEKIQQPPKTASNKLSQECMEERMLNIMKKYRDSGVLDLVNTFLNTMSEISEDWEELAGLKTRNRELEKKLESLMKEKETLEINTKKMHLLIEKLGVGLKKKTADHAQLEEKYNRIAKDLSANKKQRYFGELSSFEKVVSHSRSATRVQEFLGPLESLKFSCVNSRIRAYLSIGSWHWIQLVKSIQSNLETKVQTMRKARGRED